MRKFVVVLILFLSVALSDTLSVKPEYRPGEMFILPVDSVHIVEEQLDSLLNCRKYLVDESKCNNNVITFYIGAKIILIDDGATDAATLGVLKNLRLKE